MTTTKPLLVVGSPRSGTTLIGSVLGSAPETMDLGEYVGYDFCHRLAWREMANMPSPVAGKYLEELVRHAHSFPRRMAKNFDWFVTSAPWNLLVADQIGRNEPTAVFVLCCRRVEGVCQSLGRSYASGRLWAGDSLTRRIDLWCDFYQHSRSLPPDRTILLDYDWLCTSPRECSARLLQDLQEKDYPAHSCNLDAFASSHATDGSRPVVARVEPDGALVWQPRPSWSPEEWLAEDQRTLDGHTALRDVQAEVRALVARRPA